MAGSLRDLARPDPGRGRPRAVPLDLHRAHHRGRGRRRPHPRPDAADGRAASAGRPGSTRETPKDSLLDLLVPAAPGQPGGLSRSRPPSATCATTAPSWSSRCRSKRPMDMSSELLVDTPHGEGRLVTDRARTGRSRRCCSATAPATASRRATSRRSRTTCPRNGVSVVRFEQPWRRRRPQGRDRRPPPSTRRWWRPPTSCGSRTPLVVGGRSAGARSAARCAERTRGRAAAWRWRSRCTRRASPEKSRLDELRGAGVPTLVVQGERDPMGRPEEFPEPTSTSASSRAPTTGSRCPTRASISPGRGDGDRGRVGAGVDRPRDRRGMTRRRSLVLPT